MRFIHVGVGGFGAVWVDCLAKNKKAMVVGLVDISEDALKQVCDDRGYSHAVCFPTLKEALRHVEADAVVVTTPPAFHKQDVVTAMKAGLDAISEKPMADSMANCKAMLRTAKETGRTYVVSQNYRYSPSMWTLAKVVRSGKLGAVGQVKLDFFMGVDFGGFRHEMKYPLIIDMSIHHFDLMRFITGLDPVSVRASAWNPSWSNYKGDASSTALFEMTGGVRVLYNGSWCSKGAFADWNGNWQIECEKGTVTYEQGRIRIHHVPKGYWATRVQDVTEASPRLTGQAYVLNDFMKAVKNGARSATDVHDNINSVAMVFATVKAMETGRRVAIEIPK